MFFNKMSNFHWSSFHDIFIKKHSWQGSWLQDQSVRQWVEELCNTFSGDDSKQTFQGDSQLDAESAASIGINSRGFKAGEEKSAEEYYHHMLAELKAHKDAETWLLIVSAQEQQRTNIILLTNINSVVSGKQKVQLC